jgi:tight adherence protein C
VTVGVGLGALARVAVVALSAFFLPDLFVLLLASRRKQAIFLGLPDAIDLMVIAVEAGLGLDQAMRRVAGELVKSHPVLAHEFGIANLQLQMGISRVQMLRELAERNGEDDLRALSSVLIQASRFGSGVGQALRIQSDAMRIRRRQIAEEKAAKCSVKLIFPLVLFIFPGIFVVLAGPAALSIMQHLLNRAP